MSNRSRHTWSVAIAGGIALAIALFAGTAERLIAEAGQVQAAAVVGAVDQGRGGGAAEDSEGSSLKKQILNRIKLRTVAGCDD
jgi:hypothetical protein